ncbi:MAG: type II toxin-antitoxin system prevent-host-death family antitoxin, partial [Deltaproteobacteria bacterium]|nr:type II toxin-antitoxin system prevent-host-death family antitoxin [Deltaproteobacteria bacterium]
MKATAKDLRFHSKELIDSVRRGEEVVITFRGKPCAKLVPYQEFKNKTEENEVFGIWCSPLSRQKKYKIKVDFCVNYLQFFTSFTYLFNGK